MSKHTPGPWGPMVGPESVNPWNPTQGAYETEAGGLTIGSASHTEPICRVSGYLHDLEANARLIAAAPDLLAACEHFVWKCENGMARSKESYGQMKAAIDKAKGHE